MRISKLLLGLVIVFFSTVLLAQKAVVHLNTGHPSGVNKLMYSPCGNYLGSAGQDNIIRIWDLQISKEIKSFRVSYNPCWAIAFSPVGYIIAGADAGGNVKAWNYKVGDEIIKIPNQKKAIYAMVFSPDGKELAFATQDMSIFIWSTETDKLIKVISDVGTVYSLQYSLDMKYIYAGMQGAIKVLNAKNGQLVKSIEGFSKIAGSISVHPTKKLIASAGIDNSIVISDVTEGKIVKELKGHTFIVSRVVYSPDGSKLISSSWDHTVRVWDANDGTLLKTISKHRTLVKGLDFHPNGKTFASGCTNSWIKIWDAENYDEKETLLGKGTFVDDISFSSDKKYFATALSNAGCIVWNKETLTPETKIYFNGKTFEKTEFSNNGKYLASMNNDNNVYIWTLPEGKQYKSVSHNDKITAFSFSNDNKYLATTGSDKEVKIWEANTFTFVKQLQSHANYIHKLIFTDDGKYLIGGGYASFIVWDLATGKKINTTKGLDGSVKEIIFPSGKNEMIIATNKSVKVFEPGTWKEVRAVNNDLKSNALAISGDYKYLASGRTNGDVEIYDYKTGKKIKQKQLHTHEVWDVSFGMANDVTVSVGHDGTIRFWNLTNDKTTVLFPNRNLTDWLIVNNEGFWDSPADGGELVSMVDGLKVWNIDQFAVHKNRPDKIFENFPNSDKNLQKHFYGLYQKRKRRLSKTDKLIDFEYHVPVSKIESNSQDGKYVHLKLSFSDNKYKLHSYNLYINDVPIYGLGKELKGKNKTISEKIELTKGKNKIEVSCMNNIGTESYRDVVYFDYKFYNPSDLYFLSIGVSTYKDASLNLAYAHKDALDLEQVAKSMKGKGFENVYTKTLVNEQVTTANIKAAKAFVKNAKVDDTFILFIAGHGMHDTDEEATYYYLTHNTDLKNLKGTAATFETIEDLLQGIPPRNKLFLMDACESGELDPEDEVQYLASATEAGVNSRGFKKANTTVTASAAKQSVQNRSYLLNRNRYIYNDLVRRSGAIVFSSSKGGELSYERSDIENGLFTEFIMKALTTTEADADKDGTVSTDELRKYVSTKVAKASDGLQHPTVDRDNIYQKFGFKVN